MNHDDAFDNGMAGLPEAVYASLEGDTSIAVQRAVNEWLLAAPENRKILDDLTKIWRVTRTPAAPDGWSALERRLNELAHKPRREVLTFAEPARRPSYVLRAAAMVVIGVGLGVMVPRIRAAFDTPATTRIVAPAGSQSEIALAGGVTVRLNYASELTYTPSKKVREVELKGEAFISVPDGAAHNFVVKTEAGVVRDLGTEFNVRARQGMTSVTVTKGRVALGTDDAQVTLTAGQESSVAVGGVPTPPTKVDVTDALGWMGRRLTFFDQPLAQVAQELEYRYGVAFKVANNLRSTRITAKISPDASAADAAEVICFAVQANCHKVAESWVIAK